MRSRSGPGRPPPVAGIGRRRGRLRTPSWGVRDVVATLLGVCPHLTVLATSPPSPTATFVAPDGTDTLAAMGSCSGPPLLPSTGVGHPHRLLAHGHGRGALADSMAALTANRLGRSVPAAGAGRAHERHGRTRGAAARRAVSPCRLEQIAALPFMTPSWPISKTRPPARRRRTSSRGPLRHSRSSRCASTRYPCTGRARRSAPRSWHRRLRWGPDRFRCLR